MIGTTQNVTLQEAIDIGNAIGINWNQIDLAQFRRGLEVELEHGNVDQTSNVTNNDMLITGKIALAHLYEMNDYYTRLDMMESAHLNATQNVAPMPSKSSIGLLSGLALGAGAVLLYNMYRKKSKQ